MAHQDAVSRFSAIITAGGQAENGLASALGAREKCAGMIGGRPLVRFAVDACLKAGIERVVVVARQEVRDALGDGAWRVAEPGTNPVESAKSGAALVPHTDNIVFLPGDIPLVCEKHVSWFVGRLPDSNQPWLAVGTAYKRDVEKTFGSPPGMRYMAVRPGRHAATGLYAASRAGFEKAASLLSGLAGDRKSQFKMARRFGLISVLRYFAGLMTVEAAEAAASRMFGCQAHLIIGCPPETVLDVDTVEDFEFVSKVYRATGVSSST